MANSTDRDVLLGDLSTTGPVSRLEVSEGGRVVVGDAENNNITGGDSDNLIDAGEGFDIVRGGAGNDFIVGGGGNDLLNGGVDDDTLIGLRDDDELNGGAGDDIIRGGGGQDLLRGHTGNDYLNGGGGADRLLGGRGADTLEGNIGDDFLNGGSGVDTAIFNGDADEFTVALSSNGGSVTKTSGNAPNEGVDTIRNIEILQFDDQRILVVGAGGFETIQEAVDVAQDGDVIRIAAGTYTEQVFITNKEGITLEGEGAGAIIKAPLSLQVNETGLPAPGADVDAAGVVSVLGSRDISIRNLSIDGDDAADAIISINPTYFAGLLFVDSSGGAEDLTISNVRQPLSGGVPSADRTGDGIAIYNTDTLSRSVSVTDSTIFDFQKTGIRANGDDLSIEIDGNTINGAGRLTAADALVQLGVTVENGAGGTVTGNTISEIGTLRGDAPTAGVFLDGAADRIQVMENSVNGVDGPNTHTGVIVLGETNSARIEGNTFDGILNGVAALNDVDRVKIKDNTFAEMLEEVTTSTGGARPGLFTALEGSDNQDLVRFSGTEGSDLIAGSDVRDVIRTSGGNDRIDAGGGNDRVLGGDGDDTVNGDDGNDVLRGDRGSDLLSGGDGNDTMRGGGGHDVLLGEGGEDFLVGGGGADLLRGGLDSDTLLGRWGSDELQGGAGGDILDGGAGNDILQGQGGVDTYRFDASNSGDNTVLDFEAGETVELSGFGFANVAAAEAAFSQDGDDVVFSAGDVSVRFLDTTEAVVEAGIVLDAGAASLPGGIARIEGDGFTPVSDDADDLFVDIDDGFTEIA